jgi:hypothetical protein
MVYNDIQFEIGRDLIHIKIKNRPFREKCNLFLRRTLSAFLNLIIIFGGVYLLIKIEENNEEII